MEQQQVRPQFNDLTDRIKRCRHSWPIDIAICLKCEWEEEVARLGANPKIDNGEIGEWAENAKQRTVLPNQP